MLGYKPPGSQLALSRTSTRVKLAVKLTTRSQDACDLRLLVGKSTGFLPALYVTLLLQAMSAVGRLGRQRVPKRR